MAIGHSRTGYGDAACLQERGDSIYRGRRFRRRLRCCRSGRLVDGLRNDFRVKRLRVLLGA